MGDITDRWLIVVWKGYHVVPLISREDSRLHACIVCASVSCPNVRMEAFRPTTIDQQMDAQFQNFLANNKKGMLLTSYFLYKGGVGSQSTQVHSELDCKNYLLPFVVFYVPQAVSYIPVSPTRVSGG